MPFTKTAVVDHERRSEFICGTVKLCDFKNGRSTFYAVYRNEKRQYQSNNSIFNLKMSTRHGPARCLSDETIDVRQRMPVPLTTIFDCDDVKMPVTYVD